MSMNAYNFSKNRKRLSLTQLRINKILTCVINSYEKIISDGVVYDYSDKGVPINIRTRGNRLNSYTQIGFLKGVVRTHLIYPLYGRPNDTSRGKWNYYTLNDTGIKLPINKESRSCTGEYGCDELFDGDNVYVEGIDSVFVATIYENEANRYIPYL